MNFDEKSLMTHNSNSKKSAKSLSTAKNGPAKYDPLAWKGRLLVKQQGKEAKNWFKISRPHARPADAYPLEHPDYPFSHQRERVVCVALGKTCSAVVTRQGRLYTWGDNHMGQVRRNHSHTQQGKCKTSDTLEDSNRDDDLRCVMV
jgi:hypothetical protein